MVSPLLLEQDTTGSLQELAQQLRVDSVRCSAAASSGHPTSALSAADLMAVLLARHLRYDFSEPEAPGNDHLIFSKGHASPLYYSMLRAVGAVGERELLAYRRVPSRLEGHPTPRLPWVDVATGSLGQGLPIGVGVALAGKRLDKLPYRVWVLCGDGELAEGSIWEAARPARTHQARLEHRRLCRPVPRVRLAHPGDRRARHRSDRPGAARRGGPRRRAVGDPGPDQEGPRRRRRRGPGGRARQARPRSGSGDSRARGYP
jgi:transketolase